MSSPHPHSRHNPRQREPELESDYARSPALGYEASEEVGWVRCLAHGFPSPLARWHCHDEYELHLITGTSGKAFIGDWIGPFSPGHLVLCGPRLPHNWVSLDAPTGGVTERDLVIQFQHAPFEQAARGIPEFADCQQLLERACHGIEFFGMSQRAEASWHQVKSTKGLHRLAAFCEFLGDLAACGDYRLLSNVQIKGAAGAAEVDHVSAIISRVTADAAEPISMAEVAASYGMSESRFSRFFRRATGNTFTEFVNRVRINNACHLLMQSDRLVTDICFLVGFNNVANFNRRFLQIKGVTPTEFRRQADRRFGGSH